MKLKYFGILFAAIPTCFAQPPDTIWTWVQTGLYDTQGNDIALASNGDVIAAGFADLSLDNNAYLVRLNVFGDTVWTRAYRESDSAIVAYGISTSSNSDFYFSGVGIRPTTAPGIYVARTDSNGMAIWHRTFPGSQIGYSVTTSYDGGCAVVASDLGGGSPTLLIKLTSAGDTVWSRSYDYSVINSYRHVRPAADSGYVLFGSEWDFNLALQFSLLKANSQGDTLWRRRFGSDGSDWSGGFDLCQDGGYIMTGTRERLDSTGLFDIAVAKADSSGNLQWFRYYGGGHEGASSVVSTTDGEYIIAGSTITFGQQGRDIYLMGLDGNGDSLWSVAYGWEGADYASSIKESEDGGFALTGVSYNSVTGYGNLFVLKTAHTSGVRDLHGLVNKTAILCSVFPNPFNSATRIIFTSPRVGMVTTDLYNLSGQKVRNIANGNYPPGEHAVMLNGEGLASGIYFVRVEAGEMRAVKKIVLMK